MTGIFFGTMTEGVGKKFLAVASRELSRRIGAGISMDGLTGGKSRIRRRKISFSIVFIIIDPSTVLSSGRAGEDGAGVNGARDWRSARWAAYRRERAV